MDTRRNHRWSERFNLAAVAGLLCLAAVTVVAQAQDQPKPGPEQKKLEMLVGEWAYEGSGEATPFGPAGKFKGKFDSRLVLGGFFVESKADDTNEKGYVYQNIWICGYDPVKKVYVNHVFENDGTVLVDSANVTGNTWTSTGTRTDKNGKVYKTRIVDAYSADGKSMTEVSEYSDDDGKTWSLNFKMTAKKVSH